MGEQRSGHGSLTEAQKRLVSENIGLVALRLRQTVDNLGMPHRDREYDDLLQEGCLGLMQAATQYRPERDIPFAAFALLRIHGSISRALSRKFATVYIPPTPTGSPRALTAASERGGESTRPRVLPLTEDLVQQLSERRCRPAESEPVKPGVETIGERLRDRYERAVQAAWKLTGRRGSARGDRRELVQLLIEERFLVPDERSRRSLRQIARDTCSSFARVTGCGARLTKTIRDHLESDPEFQELRRCARSAPSGVGASMDDKIERKVAEAGARELIRRYRNADPSTGADLLRDVLTASETDIEDVIHERFTCLSAPARQKLLDATAELRRAESRANPNIRPQKAE